jgi:hypothetical protein
MKKILVCLLFFCLIIISWCNSWNSNQFENSLKCQWYLDDFESQFWTWYKNFSVFYSQKLKTCVTTYQYEWYEFISPWSRNHDLMFFVQDLFDKSSICTFANRKELYYPDSITNDSNYSINSQIKICSCENLWWYSDEDINLCNLWVWDIRELRWNQINYLK